MPAGREGVSIKRCCTTPSANLPSGRVSRTVPSLSACTILGKLWLVRALQFGIGIICCPCAEGDGATSLSGSRLCGARRAVGCSSVTSTNPAGSLVGAVWMIFEVRRCCARLGVDHIAAGSEARPSTCASAEQAASNIRSACQEKRSCLSSTPNSHPGKTPAKVSVVIAIESSSASILFARPIVAAHGGPHRWRMASFVCSTSRPPTGISLQ
mmetsp:Transcript_29440/g.73953  ORF Transcript_29440/g.73953 Transcript_29440/m.73953 type:complete len:212 (+) Transcript_29440:634-1269(+)